MYLAAQGRQCMFVTQSRDVGEREGEREGGEEGEKGRGGEGQVRCLPLNWKCINA